MHYQVGLFQWSHPEDWCINEYQWSQAKTPYFEIDNNWDAFVSVPLVSHSVTDHILWASSLRQDLRCSLPLPGVMSTTSRSACQDKYTMRESVIPRTTSEAPQSRCSTSADAESNCYTLVHCQGQYQVQVSQPLYFMIPNILLLTNGIARVLLTTLRADGLRHLCVQIESLSLPEDQFEGTRTICLKPCIIDGLPRERE